MQTVISNYLPAHGVGLSSRTVMKMGHFFNSVALMNMKLLRKKLRKICGCTLYMPLKIFKFDGFNLFGVYVCPECESMSTIIQLESSQEPEDIANNLRI